ncbi:formate dehydrogenase major subunit [Methylomarinovum tepidoasis]|uniref:NADH-quinone oxidoreductase subunit G n=1 Tax=Methylomarinovum tepidoasis TaxID=2840183 RepID=A0AAU9C7N3_9GAMM|nr:formate dehydrogenase subunit alpha [Methylomarinovum sp. IN45]BCX89284.1 formate dehydrogenase major subunit [Methylomarinovum sp. IN45]
MAANPEFIEDLKTVTFTLDGREITAHEGETILQAAKRHGIEIPHLCYKEGYRADGNCRACVVEIEGERVLAPSCCRAPKEGMKVQAKSERALKSQKMVLELLLSDMPEQGKSPYRDDSELDLWAEKLGVADPRFPGRPQPAPDLSHPAMAVNLDACIQCTRCVRACREEQANDVIGYAFRGAKSKIVFDFDDPMGDSTCVACGECVQACPTGALMPAGDVGHLQVDKKVDSTCPYCGVGCLLTFNVRGDRILYVEGRDGETNHSRLCVKGRFGFDYVHHPHRLTKPLIRREGAPKTTELLDPARMHEVFREASWEEALDRAAGGLKRIRDQYGPKALAGFGSAKGSNEEAYLFQKLVRTGFGSNNVDHCTRLCHASSVVALLECIGSGAVSNPVADVMQAEVIFLIGSNATVNHPVAATWIKNAARRGAKLIVADPVRTEICRFATHALQFRPDTDVALLNGIMHVIVEEGLYDQVFIDKRTEGFDNLRHHLKHYAPERVAPVCGIPADTIREVARLYATSKASMILWGMGVSQHVHGTDNARCLISMALMTGQIGRPGTGLHPLRGQNNVQGASDVGLIPMVFPDYQPVGNPKAREFFERLWDAKLDPEPGLTVVEVIHAIEKGQIRGMYIEGENPAMSDPNVAHARAALAKLEHLVVQDIFLTETAGFADVVLPASAFPEKTGTFTNTDRRVQLGRQAIDPPGEARQDLWIIQEIARRMGLDWHYPGPREVFEEMRRAMPSIAGITWERLEKEDSVTYPCEKEGDPGQAVIFTESFPTPTGKGLFVPAEFTRAAELPDDDYPFVFITGRQLEHWHTGAMTRHASVLDAIEPYPVVQIHPQDLADLGVAPGDLVTLESRRGRVSAYARANVGMQRGTTFMAFCYNEAAANLLTNEALDPDAKIPEFKFCAIRVRPGGELPPRIC